MAYLPITAAPSLTVIILLYYTLLYHSSLKVKCTGAETRLERCKHNGWGNHSCGHFEDAGVKCAGPDTTRECVTSCGDGYYLKKGKRQCAACSPSCLKCEDSPTTCISCDSSRFRKGKECHLFSG